MQGGIAVYTASNLICIYANNFFCVCLCAVSEHKVPFGCRLYEAKKEGGEKSLLNSKIELPLLSALRALNLLKRSD